MVRSLFAASTDFACDFDCADASAFGSTGFEAVRFGFFLATAFFLTTGFAFLEAGLTRTFFSLVAFVDLALRVPHTDIRLFGKPESFVNRRMGVALAFADDVDTARRNAAEAAGRVTPRAV